MSTALHLTITTPAVVLVDSDDVASVRAEDASGSFGILPSHADLLTMLTPSVVRWRTVAGRTGFCAVKGGVLTVSQGRQVAIACREGIVNDSLQTLEGRVRAARAAQLEADRRARVAQVQLHARAVRQLVRYLRPGPPAEIQVLPDMTDDGEAVS
jgi:F-type H+-transporting ATPase subunit epsilon